MVDDGKTKLEDRVQGLTNFSASSLQVSRFVKPIRIHYRQAGLEYSMHCLNGSRRVSIEQLKCLLSMISVGSLSRKEKAQLSVETQKAVHRDFVSILIYNVTRDLFVLVKQFRPGVFAQMNLALLTEQEKTCLPLEQIPFPLPTTTGITYELCSGYADGEESAEGAAVRELLEETGYEVPASSLTEVFVEYGIEGIITQNVKYLAEVTDAMKVTQGGGLVEEGEDIELYELPRSEAQNFLQDSQFPKASSLVFALMWFMWKKGRHLDSP